MAGTPKAYRAKDGTISYSVRYRLRGRPNPTKETFAFDPESDPDGAKALAAAMAFARMVDEIGGDAAKANRDASDGSARSVPTLAAWFETYLAEVDAHAAKGTGAGYLAAARRSWLPRLGARTVDAITRDDVVAWVAQQRQTETVRSARARAKAMAARHIDPSITVPEPVFWRPKSIKNAHTILSQALDAAVAAGLVPRNVARGVKLPDDEARREMATLTENEGVIVLAALDPYWLPMVATLYGTGIRMGEATALTVGDADLDSQVPVLRVTKAWKKGKTGRYLGAPKTSRSNRTVAIAPELVQVLRPLVRGRGADELLFTSRQGRPVQPQHFRERVWLPALKRSGIGKHVRLHDLRHTHAAQMVARGMDPKTLQDRLGHESITTTLDTYGHLRPDALEVAAGLSSGALAAILPVVEDAPQIEQ